MGRLKQKGKAGAAKAYMTRSTAIKKLQCSLADFRRLCILKGAFTRSRNNGITNCTFQVFTLASHETGRRRTRDPPLPQISTMRRTLLTSRMSPSSENFGNTRHLRRSFPALLEGENGVARRVWRKTSPCTAWTISSRRGTSVPLVILHAKMVANRSI